MGVLRTTMETEKWYWEEFWALERRLGIREKNHRDWEDLTWAVRECWEKNWELSKKPGH